MKLLNEKQERGMGIRFRLFLALFACTLFLCLPASSVKAAQEMAPVPVRTVNIKSTNPALTESVAAYYELIPAEIRASFEAMGWRIEITSKEQILAYRGDSAATYPWYYEIVGSTIRTEKLICLSDKADYAVQSIVHEMGHFFDNELTRVTGGGVRAAIRPVFAGIYAEEKNRIGDEYTASSSTEFFAESFRYYIENPALLQQKAPKTFAYVDSEVKQWQAYAHAAMQLTSKQTANQTIAGGGKPQAKSSASAGTLPPASTAKVTGDGRYLYNGLDFSTVFNPYAYYNRYPDLQVSIGMNKTKLFRHYIGYGIAEGRIGL